MERLRDHEYFLSSFLKFNKRQQREILKFLDIEQVKLLSEICANICSGVEIASDDQLKTFKKDFVSKIRRVGSHRTRFSTKKKILQRGGFVPGLIKAVGGILIQALAEKYFSKSENDTKK